MACKPRKLTPAKVYSEEEYALQYQFYLKRMREKYYDNLSQELSSNDSSKDGSKIRTKT